MIGSNALFTFAVSVSISMALLAFVIVVLSLYVGFFARWREINDYYQHPLLDQIPFKDMQFSMQAGVYLDYFLHLLFPKATKGVTGNANLLLKHVDPKVVPLSMRWPIVGFWGGLLLGLTFQVVFFVLIAVNQSA